MNQANVGELIRSTTALNRYNDHWSEQDDDLLTAGYSAGLSWLDMMKLCGRTTTAMINRLHSLEAIYAVERDTQFYHSNKTRDDIFKLDGFDKDAPIWDHWDRKQFTVNRKKKEPKYVTTRGQATRQLTGLFNFNKHWTPADEAYLVTLYRLDTSWLIMMEVLGRTRYALVGRLYALGEITEDQRKQMGREAYQERYELQRIKGFEDDSLIWQGWDGLDKWVLYG